MRLDDTTGTSSSLTPSSLRDVGREIGLDADDLAGGIAKAVRLVVGLDADDQRAALLDVVERIGARETGNDEEKKRSGQDESGGTWGLL